MSTPTTFEKAHADDVMGTLTTVDRLIVHGHIRALFFDGVFTNFLRSQGSSNAGFGEYVAAASERLISHIKALAAKAGRPYIFQRAVVRGKDELARAIAERDGVKEGLVCVFSTLEIASCFRYKSGLIDRERRKCLHLYLYCIDREFGFMHLRIQTWFPFTIQVWVNGREWLARRMSAAGIKYHRYENTFLEIEDLPRAQRLAASFCRRRWWRVFDAFARRLNPILPAITKAGYGGYYWSIDQCEVATDVMWRNRTRLLTVLDDLYEHASRVLTCRDAVRFLGAKLAPSKHRAVSSLRQYPKGDSVLAQFHPEGRRVKHEIWRNSIKLYDKWSVLRIETTINRPQSFRVWLTRDRLGRKRRRFGPMTKNLRNLWQFVEVGAAANRRYLEALAVVKPTAEAVKELETVCAGRVVNGRRVAKINVLGRSETRLFQAVLAGQHTVLGFRNHDICACLHHSPPKDAQEAKRWCAQVSRSIWKLRQHGLVAKVPGARLYRTTPHGYRVMSAVLRFKEIDARLHIAA